MGAEHDIDAQTIAGMLSLPDVLRSIGAHTRAGRRADCPFCKGASRATLSFNDRLWKCFRCNRGGDVFTLLQEKRGGSFLSALRDAAHLAGVPLAAQGPPDRAAMLKRKRDRERLERAAARLEAAERELRLTYAAECRSLAGLARRTALRLIPVVDVDHDVHKDLSGAARCEAVLAWLPGAERRAQAAHGLVAYAPAAERVRFLLQPAARAEMIEVALVHGLRTTDNGLVEVIV